MKKISLLMLAALVLTIGFGAISSGISRGHYGLVGIANLFGAICAAITCLFIVASCMAAVVEIGRKERRNGK